MSDIREYVATHGEDIYGFKVISFVSFNQDSMYFLTLGKQAPSRRLCAAFNKIQRELGYEPLLGQTPEEYLQYGFGHIANPNDPDLAEVLIADKRRKGYYSITYCEL